MKKLYFVLSYVDENHDNKFEARYMELAENTNLMCLYDDFMYIHDYEHGERAKLKVIAFIHTKKEALATCEAWNSVYKSEDRYFGGNQI